MLVKHFYSAVGFSSPLILSKIILEILDKILKSVDKLSKIEYNNIG